MAEEKNETKTVFDRLFAVDVSEHIEKKDTGKGQSLSYLSWSYAWANVKKRYPTANYEICKFGEKQTPYVYDEKTGYMVFTKVTIEGVTHEMWLPVMDNRNEAMLDHQRKIQYKNYTATVEAATMFEINKTIMRCLTKNLAMFGLGLYIYAGEDLPVDIDTTDINIKEVLNKTESWHERLEALAGYYCTDIPDENLKMIKDVCNTDNEDECKKMYERTVTYLGKKGFSV
jgi:hypothetical protein